MEVVYNPTLTEPGVKYFLRETLKKCHCKKEGYHNIIWNCGFLILFICIGGTILAYMKRHKLTWKEKKEKNERIHAHIMVKINALREEKKKMDNEIITNLPKFESNFEIMHKKYYAI